MAEFYIQYNRAGAGLSDNNRATVVVPRNSYFWIELLDIMLPAGAPDFGPLTYLSIGGTETVQDGAVFRPNGASTRGQILFPIRNISTAAAYIPTVRNLIYLTERDTINAVLLDANFAAISNGDAGKLVATLKFQEFVKLR